MDSRGFLFSWDGRPLDTPDRMVDKVACSSEHQDYLDVIEVSGGENQLGLGPTGTSLAAGRSVIAEELAAAPRYAPWIDAARRHGFRPSIAEPVTVDDRVDWALSVYAGEVDAFDSLATGFLEELAALLGHGVRRIRDGQRLRWATGDRDLLVTAVEQASEAIEITEHDEVENYPAVRAALSSADGVRVSIDDAGAGFASLRHILELQPDVVKPDIGIVRGIDADPARQALAAGLRRFSDLTATELIAEGVETGTEAATLRRLGVEFAQGYLIGRPGARSGQCGPLPLGPMSEPPTSLALVHGFSSTFDHTWRQNGWVDILADFGCEAPAFDLPGHGSSSRPTDPVAYDSLVEDVAATLPEAPGAVGFSAGADTLLRVAMAHPDRFDRLALLGLGDNVFDRSEPQFLVDALLADDEPEDVQARVFVRLARTTGNDPAAMAAFLQRPREPIGPDELAAVTCPVLVVLGDRDMIPSADRLVDSLPRATLVPVPGLDHFATPSTIEVIDATIRFFGLG